MKINKLDDELVENLKELIGADLLYIHVQQGRWIMGDGLILDGLGFISIYFVKGKTKFKLRLKFHKEIDGLFYFEFYKWEKTPPFEERYNPKVRKVNYDNVSEECLNEYPLSVQMYAVQEEDFALKRKIKSIKIYHYYAEFEHDDTYDYVAIIYIETAGGKQLIIEEDDPLHSYYIYFDNSKIIERKLAEIHDDEGGTFGKKRYQLRHELF